MSYILSSSPRRAHRSAYSRRFSVCALRVLTRRESVTNRRRSAAIGNDRRSAGGGNDLSVGGGGSGGAAAKPEDCSVRRATTADGPNSERGKRFSSEETTVLVARTVYRVSVNTLVVVAARSTRTLQLATY